VLQYPSTKEKDQSELLAKKRVLQKIHVGSGWLRVGRGGFGVKAPPLVARPEVVPLTSLTYSNIKTRMDRPKSVVRVVRGVAQSSRL